MIWDSDNVYVVWGYKPDTIPAIQWVQKSNGYWEATDRGADQDVYEANVLFEGPADELADLENLLNSNRENFNITCGEGEEIFGADIDYSSPVGVTVVDFGKIQRSTYGKYAMPLRLRLLSPIKTGTASLDNLRLTGWQYEAGSNYDVSRRFTYSGAAKYLDQEADAGLFEAVFAQTQAEMQAIRRYLLTTARTSAIAFPNIGVTKPFGQRRGDYSTFYAQIIDWQDMGRENLIYWNLKLTFAEAPAPT